MLNRITTSLVLWLLKRSSLTKENRIELLNGIMDDLFVIPFRAIITTESDGSLKINGQTVDMQQARILREQAKALLNNQVLKLINDQVAYNAVNIGIFKSVTTDHLFFAKSALWGEDEKQKLIKTLAGVETEELNP